ncbi:class I adenylate-forming enzyme family protein [Cryptosporangium aurantiacum]|uniref:Acyl-CoA synthetase (AMP-forming)/AMP-acid ligase II n=1 Tax=Cryptosporangium aurantiacum TaxID=134849 RepID=A0A1M7PJL2_9ACTN|nr:AMP-binding protein [Cryptosporangium aurantiacum]SHN17204.1 Acyl-CoA synthetase (AMP-forming)/AMP-acid ligase II [Cryptosporangium aurantiacum]
MGATIADQIRRAAAEHPDVRVVYHGPRGTVEITLAEHLRRAEAVAAGLHTLGVRRGDVVAIQVPHRIEGALAQQAGWLLGAVVLPIVPIYGPKELGFILGQSGASVFVVAPGTTPAADLLARIGPLPALRTTVVIDADVPPGAVAWERLGGHDATEGLAADPADRALLVYTSGTTADPKGVQHSSETLLAELAAMTDFFPGGPDVVHLAVFPAGHVAGVLGLLRALAGATPTVSLEKWDAAAAAALIGRYRVSVSVGAPVHLLAILDAAREHGHDLSSLRDYMLGAAQVPPHVVARANELGIVAYRGYGSSEHPTISSGRATDPEEKRLTTDGRVTPGNEVRLVDDDGADVPTGQDGEIVVRGPEQFLGYLDASLNESAYLPGGWLRTGDVGRFDDEGYLTVTDRKKDIIVRGGENISSKEVEDVLGTHPDVLAAAVVGVPDPRYGERVGAFVVLRPGAAFTVADADAHVRAAGLARQKTPEVIRVVDDLPRTPAGKVQKFALRTLLRESNDEL